MLKFGAMWPLSLLFFSLLASVASCFVIPGFPTTRRRRAPNAISVFSPLAFSIHFLYKTVGAAHQHTHTQTHTLADGPLSGSGQTGRGFGGREKVKGGSADRTTCFFLLA